MIIKIISGKFNIWQSIILTCHCSSILKVQEHSGLSPVTSPSYNHIMCFSSFCISAKHNKIKCSEVCVSWELQSCLLRLQIPRKTGCSGSKLCSSSCSTLQLLLQICWRNWGCFVHSEKTVSAKYLKMLHPHDAQTCCFTLVHTVNKHTNTLGANNVYLWLVQI